MPDVIRRLISNHRILFLLLLAVVIVSLIIFLIFGRSSVKDDTHEPDKTERQSAAAVNRKPVSSGYPHPETNATDSIYRNDRILTYETGGSTFSIGQNSGGSDCIYLNISCQTASEEDPVGYYILSDKEPVSFAGTPSIYDSDFNRGHANFYLTGLLYNTAVPSEYTDPENYGIMWHDAPGYDDGDRTSATLSVRAVHIVSGKFIGGFRIRIHIPAADPPGSSYYIEDVSDSDIRTDPDEEISEETRSMLLDRSCDFLKERLTYVNRDTIRQRAEEGALVEYVHAPYFGKFINADGFEDTGINTGMCTDVFAVTIPDDNCGYVTCYAAPKAELDKEQKGVMSWDNMDLTVFGYDPVNVQTEDTILAPDGWCSGNSDDTD